jgi:hypothetical protein
MKIVQPKNHEKGMTILIGSSFEVDYLIYAYHTFGLQDLIVLHELGIRERTIPSERILYIYAI